MKFIKHDHRLSNDQKSDIEEKLRKDMRHFNKKEEDLIRHSSDGVFANHNENQKLDREKSAIIESVKSFNIKFLVEELELYL